MIRFLAMAIALVLAGCDAEPSGSTTNPSNQSFPLYLDEPLPGDPDSGHVYQCWLGGGVTVARSANLGGSDLPRLETSAGKVRYTNIRLPDGDRARAVAVRFYVANQAEEGSPALVDAHEPRAKGAKAHPVEIVVARSTRSMERTLAQLRWVLVATWIISMLTCAGILSWLVRRGLAPLNELSKQIHSYDQEQLGEAFEIPGATEELAPVVKQLNGFVDRIQEAFQREHSFTAHAAHELRTPLSGLRSTLEVSLSQPREAKDYVDAERACLTITMQLQRLVERLLELARASASTAKPREDRVRLEALIDEAWLPLSDQAAERLVPLELDVPPGFEMITDRQLLRRVLQNVMENASDYADAGSPIELRARRSERGVQITCTNMASGVDESTVKNAFNAFWRSDSARTATGTHAGLGLALCKGFVEVLGGTIQAEAADGRFVVSVDLPS